MAPRTLDRDFVPEGDDALRFIRRDDAVRAHLQEERHQLVRLGVALAHVRTDRPHDERRLAQIDDPVLEDGDLQHPQPVFKSNHSSLMFKV